MFTFPPRNQISLLFCLALILYHATAFSDSLRFEKLSRSQTKLGIRVLKVAQHAKPGNAFVSPFYLSVGLGMLYVGADGATAKQLAGVLGFDSHPDDLANYKEMILLPSGVKTPFVLRSGTIVYVDESVEVNQKYKEESVQYFMVRPLVADFTKGDAADNINEWIRRATDAKMKDMILEGEVNGASMVLVTSAYLSAGWDQPFSPSSTQKGAEFFITPHRHVQVENIRGEGMFRVGHVPGVRARILELEYTGEELSMYIILPTDIMGLCQVQERLNNVLISSAINRLRTKKTKVVLPKFEVNSRTPLEPLLKQLGISKMFSSNANFEHISNDSVRVENAFHSLLFKVDENGTEPSQPDYPAKDMDVEEEFIVEHPFLFFVRHPDTKSLYFLGRVVDPTGEINDLDNEEGHQCEVDDEDLHGDGQSLHQLSINVLSLSFFLCILLGMK